MTASNALNIPAIGPISNTASGTFSKAYNKFYQQGWANISISLSGTTFTVAGEDGTALSSTNPAFVALQSKTAGLIKRYTITANQSFTQAGLGNSLFGVTTAVNWASDMPYYLYAVCNDAETAVAFMISRVPHRTVSPASGNIGQSGNTLASTQGSFFSLATITATDYDANPCVCLGCFRMQYASSLWTVQAIATNDGIGQFNEGVLFTYPVSQNGAATNTYFLANGGTAPIFTNNTAVYNINRLGVVTYLFDGNAFGTNGAGAVTFRPVIPLAYKDMSEISVCGLFTNSAGTFCSTYLLNPISDGVSLQNLRIWNTAESGTVVTNAAFTVSATLRFQFEYIATIS